MTEVTAGSGFFAPTLFDRYSAFTLSPAAMFALPVVRRPGPDTVTLLGGGYHASGAAGRRPPARAAPAAGLALDSMEGAGEVQTPVSGTAAGGAADRGQRLHAPCQGRASCASASKRCSSWRGTRSWTRCRHTVARAAFL